MNRWLYGACEFVSPAGVAVTRENKPRIPESLPCLILFLTTPSLCVMAETVFWVTGHHDSWPPGFLCQPLDVTKEGPITPTHSLTRGSRVEDRAGNKRFERSRITGNTFSKDPYDPKSLWFRVPGILSLGLLICMTGTTPTSCLTVVERRWTDIPKNNRWSEPS